MAEIQENLEPDEPESTKVKLANGLFVQKNVPIKDTYEQNLKKYYNGSATSADFTNGNEATDIINK